MILVDDHCHLMHEKYTDVDGVIERAKQAGVKAIICSGVNPTTNKQALEIAAKYDIVRASLGIYPVDALGLAEEGTGMARQTEPINLDTEFDFINKHKNDIAAVGEVGLDYHWVKDAKLQQQERENFEKIIGFVEKIKKPIIVHTRKAEQDSIDLLTSSSLKHVVLHCFEGKKSLISKAADAGYIFSVPTNITRNYHFQHLVKKVNINQLTTETDGPYLSPTPGTVNEPANVNVIIEKIADIKGLTKEEVANNVWLTFQRLYG